MPDLDWNKQWDKEAARYNRSEGPAAGLTMYGYQWGDPESPTYSGRILKSDFLDPYIAENHTIVEVGPGGGRFTQYLTKAKKLYLVDYNPNMFDIIRAAFPPEDVMKMTFIQSPGAAFPGISDECADRVFTFDCFVHLELNLIDSYVGEMRRVLKVGGVAIIHYADSNKPAAQKMKQDGMFPEMYPEDMIKIASKHGFRVLKEDRTTISHSSVIALEK